MTLELKQLAGLLGLCCLSGGALAQSSVSKPAAEVLGGGSRHSRAISCTNGGWFTGIKSGSVINEQVHTMEICCSEGSQIWFEGLDTPEPGNCYGIGLKSEERKRSVVCGEGEAVRALHYDPNTEVQGLQGEPWAQFCAPNACGIMQDSVSVGCINLVSGDQAAAQERSVKYPCPEGTIVDAIWAHWDQFSVHSIDKVTCRPYYVPNPTASQSLFGSGCEGNPAPVDVDMRCQGLPAERCGCLNVPQMSETPYYGCVIGGYDPQEPLPLVTLPGVLTSAADAEVACDDPERIQSVIPNGVWSRVRAQWGCLQATETGAAWADDCQEEGLLSTQMWRAMDFAGTSWDALESMRYPGLCVALSVDNTLVTSCCANLMILAAGGTITPPVPEPAELPAPVPPFPTAAPSPAAVPTSIPLPPEEPEEPEEVPEEPAEGPPPVEPPAPAPVPAPAPAPTPAPAPAPDDSGEEAPDTGVLDQYGPEEEPENEPEEDEPPPYEPNESEEDPEEDDPYAPAEDQDETPAVDDDLAPEAAGRRSRALLNLASQCSIPPPAGDTLTAWQQSNLFSIERVSVTRSKLYRSTAGLVNQVATDGAATEAAGKLGPPASTPEQLDVAEGFNPLQMCSWRRVLCGKEAVLQAMLVGGSGAVPPEMLQSVSGLRGFAVFGGPEASGAGTGNVAFPVMRDRPSVVALHVEQTAFSNTIPCNWAHKDLLSLVVVGNTRIKGPLEVCFAAVEEENVNIMIRDNDPNLPICGSGSQENTIARQIPECSTLPGVPKKSVPVSITLAEEKSCEEVAEGLQKFINEDIGFATQATAVTCNATAPAAARRLLQAAPANMVADMAGSGADWILGEALDQDNSPVVRNLKEQVGEVTSVEVDAAPPPVDTSAVGPTTPGTVEREAPPDGDDDDSLMLIIILACVAVGVVVLAVTGFMWFRLKKRRRDHEVGSLKPNNTATYVSVDASMTHNSEDFISGAVPPADPLLPSKPPVAASTGERVTADRPTNGSGVGLSGMPLVPPPASPYKTPATDSGKPAGYGTHTQAFTNNVAQEPVQERGRSAVPNGTAPQRSVSPPGGAAVLTGLASMGSDFEENTEPLTDASMISRSLSKVRTSGNARRTGKESNPPLPSSANNYPHSEELAKMSSREIHRRMRSPEVSASRRAKAAAEHDDSTTPKTKQSTTPAGKTPTGKTPTGRTPTSKTPTSRPEDSERPPNPVAERPAQGYVAAAVGGGAGADGITQQAMQGGLSPPRGIAPGAAAAAEAARLRDTYAALNSLAPTSKDNTGNPETIDEKNGMSLKAVTKRIGGSEPASPDEFSMRVGNTFMQGFTEPLSDTQGVSKGFRGSEVEEAGSPDSRGGVSVSSFTSVSVMSESTTVYTDIGNKDMEGDAMTKLEQVLNRVQRELGGQVGSFRLKGIRHRFTGRSSLVAFADGMWGGEFALKFYSDAEAAKTEFAIYRQAEDLHMALPPVQEIEDNTGGVLRLKDGTPLPPYLAMPRGLPLPDWYAMHRPRQVATLTMLSQLMYRLEKLHVSGYCHNDIKPANMVLLDGGSKKQPEWHIVDFTNMSQIGSNTRARYTLEYASPEVIRAVGAMRAHYVTCQPSMDIWSMGVIVFEVLTSKPFFPMDYNREAMKDALIGLEPLPVEEEPALFSKIPAEGKLRATVKMMLSRDTEKRPTAAMVGKAVSECLQELTGEAPEPLDASPVSSLIRDSSTAGI